MLHYFHTSIRCLAMRLGFPWQESQWWYHRRQGWGRKNKSDLSLLLIGDTIVLSTLKGNPQRRDDVLTPRTLFANRVPAYGIGWSRWCHTGAGWAHSFILLVSSEEAGCPCDREGRQQVMQGNLRRTWNPRPPPQASKRTEGFSGAFRVHMAIVTPWFGVFYFQNCEGRGSCSNPSGRRYFIWLVWQAWKIVWVTYSALNKTSDRNNSKEDDLFGCLHSEGSSQKASGGQMPLRTHPHHSTSVPRLHLPELPQFPV